MVMELEIQSSREDRLEVAKILIGNGYRVCTVVRKPGGRARTVLLVDKPDKEASS